MSRARHIAVFVVLIAGLLSRSVPAAPIEVLDFENPPTDQYGNITEAYGGFGWFAPEIDHYFEHLNGRSYCSLSTAPGPGYCAGTTSGSYVAFNFGVGAITRDAPFDFIGAFFTAGFRDDLEVRVDGFLHGNLIHSATFAVDTFGPGWQQLDFTGVDKLLFTPVVPNHPEFGTHYVIDDFTYSLVPEPGPSVLVALAFGLPGSLVRRRSH
jgi:hypothetical protein